MHLSVLFSKNITNICGARKHIHALRFLCPSILFRINKWVAANGFRYMCLFRAVAVFVHSFDTSTVLHISRTVSLVWSHTEARTLRATCATLARRIWITHSRSPVGVFVAVFRVPFAFMVKKISISKSEPFSWKCKRIPYSDLLRLDHFGSVPVQRHTHLNFSRQTSPNWEQLPKLNHSISCDRDLLVLPKEIRVWFKLLIKWSYVSQDTKIPGTSSRYQNVDQV